jgi:hypothetical protein
VAEFPHQLKKKDVDHIKGGYKGKKNHFQNYNVSSPSSQIDNINFNSPYPTKNQTQTSQVNNQTKNIPKKIYQKAQEQLPRYRYP